MKNNKQEIILLQDVVSLDEFRDMIKKNIFPLCIYLNENEKRIFKINRSIENSVLISELYPILYSDNYLYLDSYVLRKQIEDGKVYINKFLDASKSVKNVRFIAPTFDHDLGSPRVVFMKKPRVFFKKMDHFSTDSKYEGEDLLELCFEISSKDERQKRLVKSIIQ